MNLPETRERCSRVPERRKSILNAQINKRSFIIIGATTVVYTLAQLPYLYYCFEMYNIMNTLTGLTLVRFTRFSFVIMQSSCFVNPIIYFTTNKGFRKFMILSLYRFLGKKMDIERSGSIQAISLSRIEDNRIGNAIVDATRFRSNSIAMGPPRLPECHKTSVIFNVRAYYDCYHLNVPGCRSSISSKGSCTSVNGTNQDDMRDGINGTKENDILDGNGSNTNDISDSLVTGMKDACDTDA